MACEECGGLLDDRGLCTVCVAPYLQIDAGALTAAKVGGSVALPMSLGNLSGVGRPLFVTGLWSREGNGEWRPESLGWERLDAGEARPFNIVARELDRTGAHSVQVLIALASRWRWRQENFVFTANLSLMIEGPEADKGPVVNIGGQSAGHGNTVYISGKADTKSAVQKSSEAVLVPLVRAEREERRLGLRGIDADSWVPRNAELAWSGFENGDAPFDGPIMTPDGVVSVGRSRPRAQGGEGDVRLLAYGASGELDEDTSRLISRRHFELYIESDRLILRVTASGGLRVNGNAYGDGKIIRLADGDVIAPIVSAPDALGIRVSFRTEHGSARSISLQRIAPGKR
ncbi:FHA domain-containing protein [Hyphomonas sp. WL0036]|uniref:FHA domain-containing protein n=1 Tax=Hyphomonas sediminis TaxID=2866160 RepID=UPI001C7FBEC0|nr:FHA domain-containing protein [Hyphomonas sediminis]MBY9067481.1 FHA domain-containing protein [Hyphomonas sediminis]